MSEKNIPVIGEVVHIPQAGEGVTCRTVPSFTGYAVGDDGSVWSCLSRVGCNIQQRQSWKPSGVWRQKHPANVSKYGHQQTGFCREGKVVKLMVHTAVLLAFVGPCPDGMECRHFPDRDPSNNRVTNLSWATRIANLNDRYVHGTAAIGEKNHRAKTTAANVAAIRDEHDKEKGSLAKAPVGLLQRLSKKYNLSVSGIGKIVRRETWIERAPKKS